MSGTLYGIGVGPGDPDLMTLKAARLLDRLTVVAYPAPDHGESFARAIAAGHLRHDVTEIPMVVPMRTNRYPAQDVYAAAVTEITAHLEGGVDVGVLCEGDPFFYGSFMYLHARLSGKHIIEVVPGVSSLGACAAALGWPLAARNEALTILPGPLADAELRPRIEAAEAVAILKVGRHLTRLRALIDAMGLTGRAGYVAHASLPACRALPLKEAPVEAPYFSMLLIYRGEDPWLTR
ncbi:MAG: precorrin-2 C(20)-methyltransferase [Pseudomonadota bacterium]